MDHVGEWHDGRSDEASGVALEPSPSTVASVADSLAAVTWLKGDM